MPKKEEPQYPNDSFATTRWPRSLNINFTKKKLFDEKHFLFTCLAVLKLVAAASQSKLVWRQKKITERKKKIFSCTKVQLYIDKEKKLLIYQCYFGETMQAKDFHDQALRESEREEYWIRLITIRGSLMLWRGDYVRFIYSNVVVTAMSYSTS